ncbi:MAG: AMP-binding protein [Candidatus Eisenbacteria bacterium]
MTATLDRYLDHSAEAHGGRPFILFEGARIEYAPFARRVRRLAEGLRRAGLGPGDRVALALGNVPEFAEAAFALFRVGATAAPVNHFLTPPEVDVLLRRIEPAAWIAEGDFAGILPKDRVPPKGRYLAHGERAGWVPFEDLAKGGEIEGGHPRPAPDDGALLLFTSGTEGDPRGVLLTHRNLTANVDQCAQALGPGPSDRFLLFLPLFHTFSLTVCLFLPAAIGAAIVLVRSARNFPAIMRDEVLRKKVTYFIGVPAVYNALARKKIPLLFRKLHRIRVMVSGSAPLPVETIEKVEKTFGAPLLEGYGLTEAGPVVSVNRPGRSRRGTVGPPLPGVEVRIVDQGGKEMAVREIGELLVRGPNVAECYLGGSSPVREGWLSTGDLASLDDDGAITIHDRKRDLILVRGINVYPREVEEAIAAHPDVAAAAVVRAADRLRGEVPRAFVVPAEDREVIPAEIVRFLRGRLAPYKIPAHVEILRELPRGATGKVLRRVLADRPLAPSTTPPPLEELG